MFYISFSTLQFIEIANVLCLSTLKLPRFSLMWRSGPQSVECTDMGLYVPIAYKLF